MKYVMALHVATADRRNVTFGLDRDGRTWLATDTGRTEVEPAYFELAPEAFAGLGSALADFEQRADRYRAARDGDHQDQEPGR